MRHATRLATGANFVQGLIHMQATTFESLRDMLMHYAARRGWRTQRHIAVACGFDESGLSRFLNGEQDIGALRTHALFQAVGIPVDRYDLAYSLLGRLQEQARAHREAWLARRRAALVPTSEPGGINRGPQAIRSWAGIGVVQVFPVSPATWSGVFSNPPEGDDYLPTSTLIARFRDEKWTGEQIAAFFDEICAVA